MLHSLEVTTTTISMRFKLFHQHYSGKVRAIIIPYKGKYLRSAIFISAHTGKTVCTSTKNERTKCCRYQSVKFKSLNDFLSSLYKDMHHILAQNNRITNVDKNNIITQCSTLVKKIMATVVIYVCSAL
jgi:hypothetical protein